MSTLFNKPSTSITGNLDIIIIRTGDVLNGEEEGNEVLIHGDPEGLRSLAGLLLKLAELDQESDKDLPDGARAHKHLRPNMDLSKSSEKVIVGRLDAKGTGDFYERYISK